MYLRRSVFIYDVLALPQLLRWETADPTTREHARIWEAWSAYINQRRIPRPITWVKVHGELEYVVDFVGGRRIPQDRLLMLQALNCSMIWCIYVKLQLAEPPLIPLVGQFEDELGLWQNEVDQLFAYG